MNRWFLPCVLILTLFTTACNLASPTMLPVLQSTRTPVLLPSQDPQATPPTSSHSYQGNGPLSGWELYIVLGTTLPPFRYKLGYLPAACMTETQCPELKFVTTFPETDNTPSPVVWSPDGSRAIFYNGFTSQLVIYDPKDSEFRVLEGDYALITDKIIWTVDSTNIVIDMQDSDPYSSHIALLNPSNGERHDLGNSIPGMIFPLGWVNQDTLLVYSDQYGVDSDNMSQKKIVTERHIYKRNVRNDQWIKVLDPVNWMQSENIKLAPSGHELAFSLTDQAQPTVISTEDESSNLTPVHCHRGEPFWSPDSQWLAILDGGLLFVTHPDGTNCRQIFEYTFIKAVSWLPNSRSLLVVGDYPDKEQPFDKTPIWVVSLDGKSREINIPGLDLNSFNVANVTWRSLNPNWQISP